MDFENLNISELQYFKEPGLKFGGNQITEDPRDGLLLFGPYEGFGSEDQFNSYTISVGVIGPKSAVEKYPAFVRRLKQPIFSKNKTRGGKEQSNEIQRPSFPGFEAIYNIAWPQSPEKSISLSETEIESILKDKNKRRKATRLVNYYLEEIIKVQEEEDVKVDIWFVLTNKRIFNNVRSEKGGGQDYDKKLKAFIDKKKSGQGALFSEEELFGEELSNVIDSGKDFHHLLKARSTQKGVQAPIQIMVEPKLEFRGIDNNIEYTDDMKAHLAWSLSSTLYYKLGKKPWKLSEMREGVCYLGLVFKKLQGTSNDQRACSAAQLFLDDGDGTIFRGNNGLWKSYKRNEYHLDQPEAFNLLNLALKDYFDKNQTYPKELFIHGRANFSDSEWEGFKNAKNAHDTDINLVGVVIQDPAQLKLFRFVEGDTNNYGILRGLGLIISENEGYLFTRGFVPRLNTSTSSEIPNPLYVKIARGESKIQTVMQDIMALTKVNYNSCIHADGKPVTLRFSDDVGNILTATNDIKQKKRQFKYYI